MIPKYVSIIVTFSTCVEIISGGNLSSLSSVKDATGTEKRPGNETATSTVKNGTTVPANLRFVPASVSVQNKTDSGASNNDGTLFNATGYNIDNDDVDTSMYQSFTDMQTLFLACFATLVPLIISLFLAFGIRIVWRKYRRNRECRTYDGVLNRNESSAPLSSRGGQLTLSADELKTTESQFSMGGGSTAGGTVGSALDANADGLDIAVDGSGDSPVLTYSGASSRTTNHASANGSIITMTLKNNHLIVETEERNNYSNPACESPEEADELPRSIDQRALVHRPPAETFTDTEDEQLGADVNDPSRCLRGNSYTGLSQSDLSESSNCSYRYGNQQGYDSGHYGYPVYSGYNIDHTYKSKPSPDPDKPVITAAIYKEGSPNVVNEVRQKRNSTLTTMESIDSSSLMYGPLLSDAQAKEKNVKVSVIKEQESLRSKTDDDKFLEEQRALGNGQLIEDSNKSKENENTTKVNENKCAKDENTLLNSVETNGNLNDVTNPTTKVDACKELYSQLKESTKDLLPVSAPKFEKLENDISPLQDRSDPDTKEYQNSTYVASDVSNS